MSAFREQMLPFAPTTPVPLNEFGEPYRDVERDGGHADKLVTLAVTASDLFRAPNDEPYVVVRDQQPRGAIRDDRSHIAWPLNSPKFRQWLSHAYYEMTGQVVSRKAVDDAINVLSGMAQFDGAQREVFLRTAESDGAVYLDLGDDDATVIRVGGEGWAVTHDVPVVFVRSRGMQPLPVPKRGGNLALLRKYLNVADDDLILVLGWLIAALTPSGPKPVLGLHGEQGSAKSTNTRVLKRLIDPTRSELRAEPHGVKDLMIAAGNEWLPTFDNMSSIREWLSDSLCRIATGGSMTMRELYTNRDETIIEVQRPMILNGIGEVATRPDLLDRSIILNLPTISEEQRQTEEEFWRQFEQDRPKLLGFLLDSLSVALRRLPTTVLPKLPRMSDFAKLATAAEEAWGVEPGTFMAAYTKNRDDASDLVVESSAMAQAVLTLVEREGRWTGTPSALLGQLNRIDEASRAISMAPQALDWPKNARSLSTSLRRLAPVLRTNGVDVERRNSNGQRLFEVGRRAA